MAKAKANTVVSKAKPKAKQKVAAPKTPSEKELSPEAISKAIQTASRQLRGEPITDPYVAWSRVSEAVLDILALPDGQREETRELLLLLIETDPTLQEAIEKGMK